MFLGASKVTLDDKGRVAIPTRYRGRIKDRADGHLVVTVSIPVLKDDQHLMIYPQPDWEAIARKLIRLPALNPGTIALQRRLIGYTSEQDMDGHGRILINRELRDHAGIERRAMLVGQGNRLELWDEKRWEAQIGELNVDDFAELPDELTSLVL